MLNLDIKINELSEGKFSFNILGGAIEPKVYSTLLDFLIAERRKLIGVKADLYEEDYYEKINQDIGTDYDKLSKDFAKEHAEKRIEYFLKGDKTKTILEIGCAFGHTVDYLREKGYKAYGMDVSKYAIDKYPKEYKKQYDIRKNIVAEYLMANFLHAYPSLVYSFATMEHIPEIDLRITLQNIKTFLQKGGIFFATIDDKWGQDLTHKTIRPREWWDELFISEGFRVEKEATEHFKSINGYVYRRGA